MLERICYAKADKNLRLANRIGGRAQMSATGPATAAKATQDTQSIVGSRLLSVREIAQLLGMSTRWVHERTRRREIPCYRFGSVLRFSPSEVQEWLIQWRETPAGPRG